MRSIFISIFFIEVVYVSFLLLIRFRVAVEAFYMLFLGFLRCLYQLSTLCRFVFVILYPFCAQYYAVSTNTNQLFFTFYIA